MYNLHQQAGSSFRGWIFEVATSVARFACSSQLPGELSVRQDKSRRSATALITNMDHLRTEIWDSLYYSGPQTIAQIAEKLRLNHVTVSGVIDHEWFALRGDTVAIAAKADSAAVHGSRES